MKLKTAQNTHIIRLFSKGGPSKMREEKNPTLSELIWSLARFKTLCLTLSHLTVTETLWPNFMNGENSASKG